MNYERKELIYENALLTQEDVNGFKLEGQAQIKFPGNGMILENALTEDLGQKSNFVFWCPENFDGDLEISWKFQPIREPGLAIMFFCAEGIKGEDLFSENLAKRTGEYDLYHSGDINCYHVSYFRRKWQVEREFHTCNLRKSKGFHLVAQGADPIPDTADSKDFYEIKIVKQNGAITFLIDDLIIFDWTDDGSLGSVLDKGKIGFRQMAPLVARYFDLKVYRI